MGRSRPFNSLRSLANLLANSAQGEHAKKNDREAIELLRDLLREARAIDDRPDDWITHLVGAAVDSLATDTTLELSQRFQIAAATPSSASTMPTTPAMAVQIRLLIADLINERPIRNGSEWCWHGEAAGVIAMVPTIATQTRWFGSNKLPYALYLIVRPMFEIDILNLIRRNQTIAEASDMENLPAASSVLGTIRPFDYSGNSDLQQLATWVSQSLASPTRIVEMNFRKLAEHRAAAILLAIALYRAEHEGALPRAVKDLVPGYLPKVPVDPMRVDGRPFVYRPDSRPPILYSVGLNGKDDGGSTRTLRYPADRWRNLDAVFTLDEPATTEPSAETEDNQ